MKDVLGGIAIAGRPERRDPVGVFAVGSHVAFDLVQLFELGAIEKRPHGSQLLVHAGALLAHLAQQRVEIRAIIFDDHFEPELVFAGLDLIHFG